jgi:hypothetical protein
MRLISANYSHYIELKVCFLYTHEIAYAICSLISLYVSRKKNFFYYTFSSQRWVAWEVNELAYGTKSGGTADGEGIRMCSKHMKKKKLFTPSSLSCLMSFVAETV